MLFQNKISVNYFPTLTLAILWINYFKVVIDYQPDTMTVEQKKVTLNTDLYLSVIYHRCIRRPSVNLQYVKINNIMRIMWHSVWCVNSFSHIKSGVILEWTWLFQQVLITLCFLTCFELLNTLFVEAGKFLC